MAARGATVIRFVQRTLLPVAALAAVLYAAHHRYDLTIADAVGLPADIATGVLAVAGWIAGSLAATRMMDLLVWRRLGRRQRRRPPRLLMQLTGFAIFAMAAISIATNVFGFSLTGVIATSSVIGLVVGFAVKSLISDTFSGIALNLDRGVAVGDFVQIISRGIPGRLIGRVTEINWRSTHIETPENCVLVVPNTLLSESMILNLSRPESASEFEQIIVLDFHVPSERAVRILNAALQAAALDNPAIFDVKARITETSALGVHYKLKYMLEPARLAPGKAKHLIFGHVLQHLAKAGLALAHPKQDSWMIEGAPAHVLTGALAHRRALLQQVDLFAELDPADIDRLAGRIRELMLRPGSVVIRAGEPGESMFVVSEGLVSVRIRAADDEVDVARLGPGDFFGEMSVLTGEARSATVVALTDAVVCEIGKADIAELLEHNPDAATLLSTAAAERRIASSAAALRPAEAVEVATASLADQILARMAGFFGRLRRPVVV